jgi:hypothetical protein
MKANLLRQISIFQKGGSPLVTLVGVSGLYYFMEKKFDLFLSKKRHIFKKQKYIFALVFIL